MVFASGHASHEQDWPTLKMYQDPSSFAQENPHLQCTKLLQAELIPSVLFMLCTDVGVLTPSGTCKISSACPTTRRTKKPRMERAIAAKSAVISKPSEQCT